MKLLPLLLFLIVFMFIDYRDRKDNKKSFTKKKEEKQSQLTLFSELELLHPLTEN